MPETNVCIDCAIEFKADNSRSNIHTYHDIDPREYEIEFELDKIKYDVDFLLIRSIALCRHIQKVFEVIEESASSQTLRHLSAYKHSGKCDEDWCIYAWNDKDEWIAEISRYDTVWEFDSEKELKRWLEACLQEYAVPNIILDYLGIKAQFDCLAVLKTYNSKKYAFFGTADKFLQRYKEEIRFKVLCLSDDIRCNEDVNEKQYIKQRKDRLLKLYRDCKTYGKSEVFFHAVRENLIVDLAVGNVQYHFGKDAMDQMENCARYEIIIVRNGHSIARTKYVHKQADIYLIDIDYADAKGNKDGADSNAKLGNGRTAFIVGPSGFHVNEFSDSLKINALCKVLVDHGYSSNTQSQINTIEWLNDVLIRTDLYYVITRGKSCQPPSKRIKSLKIDYEKSNMNADLVKLNRILLEEFYPQETPKSLIIAVQNGYKDIVELLIKAGADPNAHFNNGETALMAAAIKGQEGIVEILLSAGTYPNAKSNAGWTALMFAACKGQRDVAELIINAIPDPKAKRISSMGTAAKRYKDIAELLIKAGADPNAKSDNGVTALMAASAKGQHYIAELLIKAGVDPNAKTNKGGNTALDYALNAGFYVIAELLRNYK